MSIIEVKNLTMKYRRYKRGSGLLNLFRGENMRQIRHWMEYPLKYRKENF
ncbi:hypothetical protein [Caldanaerobius fijiensis]|nr:hypothetical protein [Caldanaerobius fijiensis]